MIVQLPPEGIDAPAPGLIRIPTSPTPKPPPPESCKVPAVPPLVQVLEVVNGLAKVIAPGVVGNTSEKDTPVKLTGLVTGFEITIVNVAVPPVPITVGEKLFAIIGGPSTLSTAVAGVV